MSIFNIFKKKKAMFKTTPKTSKAHSKNEKSVSAPTDGYRVDLENGGYILSFYHDGNGNKVEKEKAKAVISTVFDSNGHRIQEVYGKFENKEQKQENNYGIREYDNSKHPVF